MLGSHLFLNSTRDYHIRNCDARTDEIVHALELLKEPLAASIVSARQGQRSPHGFTAFFKNNQAIGPVIKMLNDIDSLKPTRGKAPYPFRLQPPIFVCLKPNDGYKRFSGYYKACVKEPDREGSIQTFVIPGKKYVFLCPTYFDFPMSPIGPLGRNCLRVADNKFVNGENIERLVNVQKYMLLHELAHFYLGQASLDGRTVPTEAYNSNICVNLDPKLSLRNPMNYQFFVASKSAPQCHFSR